MGSMREIRARIKSVKNTQQITKTMKMVASAKLRRTQKGLNGIRSFAESSRHILGDQKSVLCSVRGQPRPVRRI